MPKITNAGFRQLGTGFASAQAMSSLPYVNRNKAVGKARGQVSKVAGQVNDAIGKAQQIKTGINQVADTVGDVLGLFKKGHPVGNTDSEFSNYKVKIFSATVDTNPIEGYLQGDSLDMSLRSTWESAFQTISTLAGMANAPSQMLTGTTAMMGAFTRRIWTGNAPLRLSLPLKFQATKDSTNDVLAPCQALQLMVSPGVSQLGFLTPPGPNPYNTKDVKKTLTKIQKKAEGVLNATEEGAKFLKSAIAKRGNGDLIRLTIGRFLRFDNIIITDLDIKYATKFDYQGIPVSAEAIITFETFEVLTKNSLINMYTYKDVMIAKDQTGDK